MGETRPRDLEGDGPLRQLADWITHPWLTVRVQIALGAVFVAAALPKIADPPAFAHMIYNYRLLPGGLVNALALVLPWVELLAGAALILGVWKKESAVTAAVLLLVFLVAIGINLARDHAVDCGCFDVRSAGKSREELLPEMKWVLLRDVGLLLLAAQILAAERVASGRRITRI
ncbi:MAG TPA: MauE/DoxX family redox-associated membrane protein [Thermoanaerobaculia bacterium]|nr:MauE/DoxX family redox-associated membrane protein [Thermoanaerobaculia bacterium]